MPKLSNQYAYIVTQGAFIHKIEPLAVTVTVDEAFAPYCSATVTIARSNIDDSILESLDPRLGDRITLHMQQDFGDLVYCYEITDDFGGTCSTITAGVSPMVVTEFTRRYTASWNVFEPGLPLSTVTAAYAATCSVLTANGYNYVWRMSDFLHGTGAFNPAPSTIFHGDLHVRETVTDYIAQTITIELASDELLAQDRYAYGPPVTPVSFTSLRAAVGYMLQWAGAGTGANLRLDPAGGDYTFTTPYVVDNIGNNASKNLWDELIAVVNSAGFTLWCDEARMWHLAPTATVAGSIELKDSDNVTAFSRTISRNGNWYSDVILEYATETDMAYNGTTPPNYRRMLYLDRKDSETIATNGALTIMQRANTRAETFSVEAINNFDARPRQSLTVDISDRPLMSGVVQAVTWSLPSATMELELRDLVEV